MSPLNRGPLMGPRIPPAAMRQPMRRFARGPPPLPRMALVPPPPPGMFGPPRGRPIPPPLPGRAGPMLPRGAAPVMPRGPPMFGLGPRGRPLAPPMPPIPMRVGPMGPHHGPMMRPGPRGILPPHALPHMRPKFPAHKAKSNHAKKNNSKIEDLEMKKPWMTDEIRSEIQKKNKLYAKSKKNKGAKEWEEFKDLRNKVTRMIRDAKNEYLAKHPEQVAQKTAENKTVENESVQKTDNTTEQTEKTELNGESEPSSEQAQIYKNEPEFIYDEKEDDGDEDTEEDADEEETCLYCEICDRDFESSELLERHIREHRTCKIDGCTFTAHPKIVDKHISMQHATGLYQRMKCVMTDQDVEKWKEERKKRYPTSANKNVEEAELLEKKKRGEVVGNHNKKNRRDFVKKDQPRKNRKRRRNRLTKNSIPEEVVIKVVTYRGLVPFAGLAALNEKPESCDEIEEYEDVKDQEKSIMDEVSTVHDIEITDEEDNVVTISAKDETKLDIEAPKMLGLVADYGSDSDDEPPEELPIKKIKVQNGCEYYQEIKTQKEIDANVEDEKKVQSISNVPVSGKNSVSDSKKSSFNDKRQSQKQNTKKNSKKSLRLLNKLLARSMQHERNAIFQCLTFIKNNNFFD